MSVLTDSDLARIINRKDIVIYPYDPNCLTGLGYDLRIGRIVDLTHYKEIELNDRIVIPAKSYCVLLTKEFVWLSGSLIGTLHARGTLAAKGIYTNSTNVDPNFQGQMIMSIYNVSNISIELEKEDTFITLIIHKATTHTSTLVGEEGRKKSTRVLEEMTEKLYLNKKDCVDKLHHFYSKSDNEFGTMFTNLINDAKNRNFLKSINEYFSSFRISLKKTIYLLLNLMFIPIIICLLMDPVKIF